MHYRPVALVTGANKGIGLQIATELAARDFTVLVGSRNQRNGEIAAEGIGQDARAIQLDVTDQGSIDAAASRIRDEFGRLDVLVNNAGVGRVAPTPPDLSSIEAGRLGVVALDEVRAVLETNVLGVIAVTQAVLPLLREAPNGRIVNMGSSVASLTLNSDPTNPQRAMLGNYALSKAALHAVTVAFAAELASTNVKVNVASPGFIATAINNFQGTGTVEQGARAAVHLALLDEDGPTGTFSGDDGPIPW